MSCDIEIKIFGTVARPEAIWELANSAAAEGRIDWTETVRRDAFLDLLIKAENEGGALTLTKHRTTDFFEEVRASCQEAGLSYIVNYGDSGAEGFIEGFSWRPGMDKEFHFLLDGKDPTLKVEDIRKAAMNGLEAVNALVDDVTRHTTAGKIVIAPGFIDAYREFDAGPETLTR